MTLAAASHARGAAPSWRRLGLALFLAGCTDDIQLAPLRSDMLPLPSAEPANCAEALVVERMGAPDACVDPLARLFRYALCSCEDVTFSAPFETVASDAAASASIGTNRRFEAIAPVEIAGSWISSDSGADCSLTGTRVHVAGNFKAAGDLNIINSQVTVDRDLWVHGRLSPAGGTLRVAGVTYLPPGRVSIGDIVSQGGVRSQEFSVAPACACAERQAIDFDQVARGFSVQSTELLHASVDLSRQLACGRYRLEPGRIAGARFRVLGRVALFVDGDLELADRFEPELGPSAVLDVFVRGALSLAPGVSIGSIEHPGTLRFFAGGASKLVLTGGTTFAASVYAPLASVSVAGEQVFHGSLHVGDYRALSHTAIHYDPSESAADGCFAAAACVKDMECEDPLACVAGRCALSSLP